MSPSIDDFRKAVMASAARGYYRAYLMAYADHHDRDCPGTGRTYLDRARAKEWLGCSPESVRLAGRRARKDGWLVPVDGAIVAYRGHSPRYYLAVPDMGLVAPSGASVDNREKGGRNYPPSANGKGYQKGGKKGGKKGGENYPPKVLTNDLRPTTEALGSEALPTTAAATPARASRPAEPPEAYAAAVLELLPDTCRPEPNAAVLGVLATLHEHDWTPDAVYRYLAGKCDLNAVPPSHVVTRLRNMRQIPTRLRPAVQSPLVALVRDSNDTTPPPAPNASYDGLTHIGREARAALAAIKARRHA